MGLKKRVSLFVAALTMFSGLAVVGAPAAFAAHPEIEVSVGCEPQGDQWLEVVAKSWSFVASDHGNHDDVRIQMRRINQNGNWTGWLHEIGNGQFVPGNGRQFTKSYNKTSTMADFGTLESMAGQTVQIRIFVIDPPPTDDAFHGWYNDLGQQFLEGSTGNGDARAYSDEFVIPKCVPRLAGANRYSTAAAASQYAYPSGADVVYVATGEKFPDALAGGAAAARENAPILLVQKSAIPSPTKNELVRLSPSRIVVLGGTDVIDNQVVTALRAYAGSVTRVAGANRYSTSAAVSKAAFGSSAVAYVATGVDFPDALAGAPAAVQAGAPLLLVKSDELPNVVATELNRLGATSIVVVGGTAAVSDAVVASLAKGGRTVTRISGATRYALSANVSKDTFAPGVGAAYVVVGTEFPDALSAGAVTGPKPGPVLLVQTNSLPAVVAKELTRLAPQEIYIIGGPAVVSDTVAGILAGYVQ